MNIIMQEKRMDYMGIINIKDALKTVKKAAFEAGQIILKIYNEDFKIEYKEDDTPLTKADRQANEHIVGILRKEFPDIAILAEESLDDRIRLEKEFCWIVDPLDGTKEFIKKNGEFTVNIALVHLGRPVLGVVYVPVRDEMYCGAKNLGAYYIKNYSQDKKSLESQALEGEKISVSKNTDSLIMLHSRSHRYPIIDDLVEKNKSRIKEMITVGSSLKGCLIAKGEADIYYRFGPTMEWDTAAIQCIVEEAGGILRQMDDSEMIYNRKDSKNRKGFYILNNINSKLEL
jgi:3'(2'), 5'-bisphosphate nucleotidase